MMMVATATKATEPTSMATPTLIIRTTRTKVTMMTAPTLMIEDTQTRELTHKEPMVTMMNREHNNHAK